MTRLRRIRRVIADVERGASAVVVALSMVALMAAAALGFDISNLYYQRQMVRNAIDAASQAGAAMLPTDNSGTTAANIRRQIIKVAQLNYPDITLAGTNCTAGATDCIQFLCIVANTNGSTTAGIPDPTQIPSTCNPGTYDASKVKCSTSSCAIPCDDTDVCNAVNVSYNKQVNFAFAPAIGIDHWMTGAVSTVSCRGTCGGQAPPNPMNVVVMADRTPSMWGNWAGVRSNGQVYGGSGNDDNLKALRSGIQGMLGIMTPAQQYVAFGAIHKSAADGSTAPLPSGAKILTESTTTTTVPYCTRYNWWGSCTNWVPKTTTTTTPNDVFAGSWVPVGFSKDYQNPSSTLSSNVANLTYSNLVTSGPNGTTANYVFNKLLASDGSGYSDAGTGTHLAAALKGAAQYLLTNVTTDNMVTSLEDGTRADLKVKPRNVIILETDGQPSEVLDNATSDNAPALSLGNGDDIGAGDDVNQGCKNLETVAAEVKAAGITIITIGYGSALTNGKCSNSWSAAQALAQAASTQASVTGSGDASSDCDQENSDNDYYYCASNNNQLKKVFAAAMGSITGGTKFMAIDGVSD